MIVPISKNMTIKGWELIKPLPGQAMNLTIGAWNYIAPKASNVVQPALNFVGDMIAKGYNFVTSAFDMDFDDIVLDFGDDEINKNLEYGKYDSYENYENEEEYEEVKAMIDAGFTQ
jgi:cysteinyl-tRNA synthetase